MVRKSRVVQRAVSSAPNFDGVACASVVTADGPFICKLTFGGAFRCMKKSDGFPRPRMWLRTIPLAPSDRLTRTGLHLLSHNTVRRGSSCWIKNPLNQPCQCDHGADRVCGYRQGARSGASASSGRAYHGARTARPEGSVGHQAIGQHPHEQALTGLYEELGKAA